MAIGPNTKKNTPARAAAQKKYSAKPEQKKRRAMRNKARREMIKAGKAHKGDGKDVEHKDGNPMHDKMSNYKMGTKRANRSYPRTRGGHKRNPRD